MELTQDTDYTMESYIKFRNLFSHNIDVKELLFKDLQAAVNIIMN